MAKPWWHYLDPSKVLDREQKPLTCRGCYFNSLEKTGRQKRYFCGLGHDQAGGTKTAKECGDWRKGVKLLEVRVR